LGLSEISAFCSGLFFSLFPQAAKKIIANKIIFEVFITKNLIMDGN